MKAAIFQRPLARRRFLFLMSRLSAALALGALPALAHGAARRVNRLPEDPFYLGVASGDPRADAVVLWTRLDPAVLRRAGLDEDVLQVDYEVATDAGFSRIERAGSIAAAPELGHSAHADVRGLRPDREYFYRWRIGGVASPAGRTRTAAAGAAEVDRFRFAFASCQQYEHGYYTAYRHMAEENFDLIVHLGDYIYERTWGENLVRSHEGPEIHTLAEYRARYETYRSDTDLQAAHASAPWAVTWDDHEVDNNYAAQTAEDEQTQEQLLARRAAGYQAWYEFMPVRLPVGRQGPDMPIHRRLRFGKLLEMNVLDTRQYRDDQACGDGRRPSCAEHMDPSRSLLGQAQKRWLLDGLASADARWNVLAQQIMMAGLRAVGEGGEQLWPMDIWDGYPFERRELLQTLADAGTPNPVVITGDIHTHWAAELKPDFDDPASPVVGSEFVGSSISSGGDGEDSNDYGAALLANNPHVKFFNAQRGYVANTITPAQWRTDYKVLPRVTVAGAPISIRKSYIVEDGDPRLRED